MDGRAYEPLAEIEVDQVKPEHQGFMLTGQGPDNAEYQLDLRFEMPLDPLPGIASVLRSPVADALVKAIRAAAGVGDFSAEDAEELVRYAVRRGLIGPDEGDRVLGEVQVALKSRRKVVKSAKPKAAKKRPAKKKLRR